MLEVVLGLEFVICVCTWSFLGQLLRGSQSANFYQYGTPSVTSYMTVAQTMVGLAFGILVAFLVPAVVSWGYTHSSRKFKRDPIFPKSQFYIGIFMIFSVVKVLPFFLFFFFFSSFLSFLSPFRHRFSQSLFSFFLCPSSTLARCSRWQCVLSLRTSITRTRPQP